MAPAHRPTGRDNLVGALETSILSPPPGLRRSLPMEAQRERNARGDSFASPFSLTHFCFAPTPVQHVPQQWPPPHDDGELVAAIGQSVAQRA